jgi:hypothetical protein
MRNCAVFTMVKNETWFLPIWLNYYSKHFEEKDIYVIDHASTDESIELVKSEYPNITIIPLTYEPFDDIFKINEIKKQQTLLLKRYKCVLYTDPDEMVVPINTLDLKEYITDFLNSPETESVKTNGWEIIHLSNRGEEEINLTESILSQRSYWFHSPQWYSKVLLSKKPLNWAPGLYITNNNYTNDESLYLIHLHRIDYSLAYLKNIINSAFKRPPGMNLGNHVFITDPTDFHNHFWGMENSDIIKEIPNNIKESNLF